MTEVRDSGSKELSSSFHVLPSENAERPGAYAHFPYDRDLLGRFRQAFPRARWRGEEQGWFVPGTTAVERLDAWMARELQTLDRHADAKGRDAYAFEPLQSPYLTVADDLQVRTPYSRTIVEALRSIPFARWDPESRIWRVPFRSYERLRLRWPEIEDAARRNEPAEKRRRREERHDGGLELASVMQAERRRRRYPVPGDDLPPLGMPVATLPWGVLVFEDIGEEPVAEAAGELYPHVSRDPGRYVWARWRMPTLQEIYRTRPAQDAEELALRTERGWWWASRDELRERAKRLRETERAQQTRSEGRKDKLEA